jgi:hypothetical protein
MSVVQFHPPCPKAFIPASSLQQIYFFFRLMLTSLPRCSELGQGSRNGRLNGCALPSSFPFRAGTTNRGGPKLLWPPVLLGRYSPLQPFERLRSPFDVGAQRIRVVCICYELWSNACLYPEFYRFKTFGHGVG